MRQLLLKALRWAVKKLEVKRMVPPSYSTEVRINVEKLDKGSSTALIAREVASAFIRLRHNYRINNPLDLPKVGAIHIKLYTSPYPINKDNEDGVEHRSSYYGGSRP